MSATALARKYRSRNFDELVGQTHVVRALTHALQTGRLHHAYLLTGTRGVGKTTIARILAKCLNCETGITPKPCEVCSACVSVNEGRFVDLIELDAASNTGVDDMREIIENARYAPTVGRMKVYLIDEVHMLSKSAFNAMLKTLEEPPEHVKFVLATTDPQKIPVTVLSRCLQFNLKQFPSDQIAEHLTRILKAENVPFDAASVALLARAGAGSMRDALSITDQAIAFGQGKLVAEQVRQLLGVVDTEYVLHLAQALAAQDGPALLAQAEALYERGVSFDSVLQELAVLFHDLALKQAVPTAQTTGAWNVDALVGAFDPETVQVLYQIAVTGRRDLPLAPDERAGFTMTLLRMLAFVPGSASDLARTPAAGAPRSEPSSPKRESAPLRAAVSERSVVVPPAQAEPAAPESTAPPPDAAHPAHAKRREPFDAAPADTPARPSAALAAPASAASALSTLFDGDWPALIARLPLVALTREFARHSALVKIEGNTLYLLLPEDKRALMKHQGKLRDILSEYFGKPVRLEVELGTPQVASEAPAPSLAIQEAQARSERLAQAQAEFLSSPFVQALIKETGAVVHTETIQPIELAGPLGASGAH